MSPNTPVTDAALRASDAERERHADLLREHAAAGRITVDELAERVERVYASRTRGELDQVLHDLPSAELPAERVDRAVRRRKEFFDHLRPYVLVNLLLIAIWAATGAGYFWPAWPLLGWGIGLLAHASEAFGGRSVSCRRRVSAVGR